MLAPDCYVRLGTTFCPHSSRGGVAISTALVVDHIPEAKVLYIPLYACHRPAQFSNSGLLNRVMFPLRLPYISLAWQGARFELTKTYLILRYMR